VKEGLFWALFTPALMNVLPLSGERTRGEMEGRKLEVVVKL